MVWATSVSSQLFLEVAENIFCESGVRLTPDVSLSEPLPRQSSDA